MQGYASKALAKAPPTINAGGRSVTLQMRVSASYLRSINEWRRRQPDLPSRSEAIRRLTTIEGHTVRSPAPTLDGGLRFLGRSQLLTFAAKYAKRSTVLRAGDAEHKLSLPIASDAARYFRFKRGTLKGHGTDSQPMRRFSAAVLPVRVVTSS